MRTCSRNARPEPATSAPSQPAASARATASRSVATACGYSERT